MGKEFDDDLYSDTEELGCGYKFVLYAFSALVGVLMSSALIWLWTH